MRQAGEESQRQSHPLPAADDQDRPHHRRPLRSGHGGPLRHRGDLHGKHRQEPEDQLVTTLRQDALKGLISKESPVGEGRAGPPGRGPGTGGYGRRPQLLDNHSFH